MHHFSLPAYEFPRASNVPRTRAVAHIVADFALHEHVLHKHVQMHTVSMGVVVQQQTEASRQCSFTAELHTFTAFS